MHAAGRVARVRARMMMLSRTIERAGDQPGMTWPTINNNNKTPNKHPSIDATRARADAPPSLFRTAAAAAAAASAPKLAKLAYLPSLPGD